MCVCVLCTGLHELAIQLVLIFEHLAAIDAALCHGALCVCVCVCGCGWVGGWVGGCGCVWVCVVCTYVHMFCIYCVYSCITILYFVLIFYILSRLISSRMTTCIIHINILCIYYIYTKLHLHFCCTCTNFDR